MFKYFVMNKIYYLTFSLFITLNIFAQTDRQQWDPVTGNLLFYHQTEKIDGSPFLKDKWEDASVVLEKGYTFKHVNLKFDIYNNVFVFNRHDTAFVLGDYVAEIQFFPNSPDTSHKLIFRKGYSINSSINNTKFLQVLTEGKLTLLKYYQKETEEYTEYGNAVKFKRFNDKETYYVLKDGQYKLLNLSKKSLENLLQTQYGKIEAFLKAKDLSGKDEDGWVAAINYSNSLIP